MNRKKKILIVDDHSFTRAGIKAIVETSKTIEVVGEAIDGNDAVIKVLEKEPDIIIMDVNMPGLSGIEATKEILLQNSNVKIMALSMHSGVQFVKEMLQAGAAAYLLKDDAPEELLKAIEIVLSGEMFLSAGVTKAALSNSVRPWNSSILETKLHRPPIFHDYISRKKIINKLEKNATKSLSIISAGAGYGKSIAVSEWLENTSYLSAWLSLDDEHNDFQTFMIYVVACIERIFPEAMKDSIELLKSGNLPPFNSIFTSFINDVCGIDQDFILVLDDFHLLREKKIHQFFDEWLRFPPPNVHLSIITRRDPALNVSSIRNSGGLIEIRMNDLCLSNMEVADLFKILLGIQLKEHTIKLLQEKTEGWIIALRLASMALSEEGEISKLLNNLEGGTNMVSEYLISEVLTKQPNEILQRIIESSALNRFCPELIDSITKGKSSIETIDRSGKELIEWLLKSNMFIISLDYKNSWYRYHHLFQQMLQNELVKRRTTAEINEIHRSASVWFEQNNFITEAIEHSIKGQNTDRAIEIIEKNWEDAFEQDLWYNVNTWISLIQKEDVVLSVNLLLARFWIFQKSHMVDKIPALITLIEQRKTKLGKKELGFLSLAKSIVDLFTADARKGLAHAELALKLIPRTHYIFRADTFGWWTLAMLVNGRGNEAVVSSKESIKNLQTSRESVQLSRRTMHLNFVYMFNAELSSVNRNLKTFFEIPKKSSYSLAFGYYFRASLSWWSYELEESIGGFEQVIKHKYQCRPRIAVEAYIGLAIALWETNKPNEANEAIIAGIKFAEHTKDPVNINIITSGHIRLKLLQGELGSAEKWLKKEKQDKPSASMLWWIEVSAITRCRVLIAISTNESLLEALEILEVHKVYTESIFNKLKTYEIVILQARAFLKLKQKSEAIKALEHAWSINSTGELIRPFIEESGDLLELLLEIKRQGKMIDLVDLIQSKFKQSSNPPEHDQDKISRQPNISHDQQISFTRKEMEVLLCVSEGLRNSEIADKLYNSEETIKKHLSNMFQKIDVRNRVNLISKAKKLGMLE